VTPLFPLFVLLCLRCDVWRWAAILISVLFCTIRFRIKRKSSRVVSWGGGARSAPSCDKGQQQASHTAMHHRLDTDRTVSSCRAASGVNRPLQNPVQSQFGSVQFACCEHGHYSFRVGLRFFKIFLLNKFTVAQDTLSGAQMTVL